MELKNLEKHIFSLATMEETDAPVISCYLGVERGPAGYRNFLDERVRVLRTGVAPAARQHFEEALEQIEVFLRSGVPLDRKGMALFSRGGDQAFFLPLEFEVPLTNWIAVDAKPNIYRLVELKDTYDRYVVLLATESVVRILGINLGSVTEELWNTRPELRHRAGREWTKEHYQAHRRERISQFIHEQIRVLSRVMLTGGYRHLLLAGDPRATGLIRKALPRHLEARLIGIVPAAGNDRASDIVAATLSSFVDYEERESQSVAERLCNQSNAHRLAVVGARASLRALDQWQVDILVLAKAYEPDPGWVCTSCGWRHLEPPFPTCCPRCGAEKLRTLRIKEEMVRLAEQRGAVVEIVNESDGLMHLGGVGCLLRYLDREECPRRAA